MYDKPQISKTNLTNTRVLNEKFKRGREEGYNLAFPLFDIYYCASPGEKKRAPNLQKASNEIRLLQYSDEFLVICEKQVAQKDTSTFRQIYNKLEKSCFKIIPTDLVFKCFIQYLKGFIILRKKLRTTATVTISSV